MKKSRIKLTAILVLGLGVLSCQKEAQLQQVETQNTITVNWSVPIDDLSLELETIFSKSGEYWEESGVGSDDYLIIESLKKKVDFYLISNSSSSTLVKKIVCTGSGGTFALCVKEWLEAHPGKCLTVWETDGTYSASDNCEIP